MNSNTAGIPALAKLIPQQPGKWIGTRLTFLVVMSVALSVLRRAGFYSAPQLLEMANTPLKEMANLALNMLDFGSKFCLIYVLCVLGFKRFRVHQRFGIFKIDEPASHYWTSLRNWRTPFIWGAALALLWFILGLDGHSLDIGARPKQLFALPDRFIFLHSPNLLTDLAYAVAFFYFVDLTDYSAHRFNHSSPYLYNKFPFGHFVHHNLIFVNPYVIAASPAIHFTSITAFTTYAVMLSQGLVIPLFMLHSMKILANMVSHLGCDPLPWLSRLNYRVGGWIPWIPVHHQYHHIPGVKGNYGNLTSLWDHVFGTLSPEYVQHMENGQPSARILRVLSNTNGAIDRLMRGKTGWNIVSSSAG